MAVNRSEIQRHSELLARAADGDHAAFHLFYSQTRDLVFRYVVARVRYEDAEDLMAETYLRAYRSAATFQDLGQPAVAWLMTIARNLIVSHYRSTARRQRGRAKLASGDDRLAAAVDDDLVDRSDDAVMLQTLGELKPRHRQVLELRFFEQRSVAECAAKLAMTEQGVRALTYRALQAMRARLGDDFLRGRTMDEAGGSPRSVNDPR